MGHYYKFPNTQIYPNSFFPEKIQENSYFKFFMGILILKFLGNMAQTILLGLSIALSYMKGMVPIISNEFKLKCSCYRTVDDLRKVQNLPKVYRALELYHKVSMELMGPVIIPVETVLSQLVLTCNFIIIKHGEKLSLIPLLLASFWTLLFQSVWIIFLNVCGLFFKHSAATIASWKSFEFKKTGDSKVFGKFRRSCRVLRIGHGELYAIKRLTVLTFLRGIIRGTFRALLTLRNTDF